MLAWVLSMGKLTFTGMLFSAIFGLIVTYIVTEIDFLLRPRLENLGFFVSNSKPPRRLTPITDNNQRDVSNIYNRVFSKLDAACTLMPTQKLMPLRQLIKDSFLDVIDNFSAEKALSIFLNVEKEAIHCFSLVAREVE